MARRVRASRARRFRDMSGLIETCVLCAGAYFTTVLAVMVPNFTRLFTHRFGRGHRVAGLIHLLVLLIGVTDLAVRVIPSVFPKRTTAPLLDTIANGRGLYDLVLGVSGCVLTYTAAVDFGIPKYRLRNAASGALDANQTVTREEITEHAFYQLFNLIQVFYLRYVCWVGELYGTQGVIAALTMTTSVWLLRSFFPTNRFSDNYVQKVLASTSDRNGTTRAPSRDFASSTSFMYRLKKYQYVFLKHFLQHGLNVGVAMTSVQRLDTDSKIANAPALLVDSNAFRLYWLTMNSAFVMEFFMQTLVKKKMLKQNTMLRMNVFLMATSSMAVFFVLREVHFPASIVSLNLNFLKPGRELRNVLVAVAVAVVLEGTSVDTSVWPVGTATALLLCVVPATMVEKNMRAMGVTWRREDWYEYLVRTGG